ncbi:restriction endonuclease subunit S [Thioalbus denitrificans]|uniref:Type I restriction enzyme S subunit n=1 Tax=Thioalbus denitrificans TaxID=547122 RepID=A0A369CHQ2_9GAMM|nr:restriction endonuclease subunit S [Thioalbus denitrificans]RCX32808.1 type I restriction enzyme S subunit [Thioalbus denitrificans]
MSCNDSAVPLANGLPAGWEWSTLGAVSEKPQYGWTTKANHETGELKLLRTTDITSGSVDWSSVPYCTEVPEDVEKYLVETDDILISRAGSIGVSFLINKPERAVFASYLIRFRPKTGIDIKYFYYYLKSPSYWEAIGASKAGIAVPNVNASKLAQVPIPVAPLDQQRRIVAEIEKQFSRLDEAVANLKRVKANLKRYKAAVLKAAVEGRLVETEAELARREGRSYENGAELLQRILETRRSQWKGKGKYKEPAAPDTTDLPELPEGWVWATVEQLNLANRPCAYGVLQPGDDLADGIPFIRVGDIDDGQVDLDALKRISPAIAAKYPRTRLVGGEFLITLVGAIGRTALVQDALKGANVARAVGVVPLAVEVDANWFEIWFRNPAKVVEMTSKSHEVARKTLNLEDVRAASVAVPPIAEQQRIVAEVDRRLSLLRVTEAQVDANLQRAERLRQAILSRSFVGRVCHG